MEPDLMGLVAHLATDADLPHFGDIRPAVESTLATSPSEISVVVYDGDRLRQVWEPSITLVIIGCGTFRWNDPGTETTHIEDVEVNAGISPPSFFMVSDGWRFTVDLRAVGCTLSAGVNMAMIIADTVSSANIGSARRANSMAWTFAIDGRDDFVLPLDPPQALEIGDIDPNWGRPGRPITLRGTGFIQPSPFNRFQGSRVHVLSSDGPVPVDTTVVDDGELRFAVPSALPCGGYMLQVHNPEAVTFLGTNVAYQSSPVGFEIQCVRDVPTVPTPEIASLSPDQGPPGTSVTVTGSGFLGSNGDALSTVHWDGNPLEGTEYVSASELRFKLPLFVNCGEHEIQVRNPGPQFNSPPIPSNTTTLTVTCDDEPPTLDAPIFDVTALDVVGNARLGATVQVRGEVANTGDVAGTAEIRLEVNGDSLASASRAINPDEQVTFTSEPFTFDTPGTYTFRLHTQNDERIRTVEIAGQPGNGGEDITGLASLDANGNCVLDTPEFLNAIDAWINEGLPNDVFFDAIDAWVAESDVCGSAAGLEGSMPATVHAQMAPSGRTLHMTVSDPAASLAHVRVFNLAGEVVFEARPNRSRLSWHLHLADGRPIPNGVYLYRATVQDSRGERRTTDIQRVVVVR